ncbi:MAG: hypothetical protein GY774_28460 [Planctomycetes bacterium]|nr:hypothetical protein [Planctomycetota bacterium]
MKNTITNILHRRAVMLAMAIILTATLTGIVHAQTTTVVACVGASQTAGWDLPTGHAYPAQMEEILQRQRSDWQWVVHNFGVSGNTVLRRGDKPYSTTRALALKPDIVIFHFGGNATRNPNRHLIDRDFVQDYGEMINAFAQLDPVPKMWICLPTAFHSTAFTASPDLMDNKVNPYIHDVAAIAGLPIIDLFSVFKDAPELYQADGVHLASEGAALMADIIAATILGSMRGFPPDFNGDSTTNIEDLVILIEHWGQDEPSLDIAPAPWGDGIVSVQDLEAVMQYWGQDVNDPTLVAHWALDESEGTIARDSVSENNGRIDGYVIGEPVWQPAGGRVDGAIQLDGVDDLIITSPVLNPADGPFSVLAWIKSDATGQTIISAPGGANWLGTDPLYGFLMTELAESSTTSGPLLSETTITDDKWHHIGFMWDGSNRTLYVDSIAVAHDTQNGLKSSSNGLYIGTGNAMQPGTYFSGLIDDVRIYNRVIIP